MPTVYEYVRDGQVVERVQPVDLPDDFENTRLGVAVLDAREAAGHGELGREYWRVAGHDLTNASPEPAAEDPAGPDSEPDTAAPARPATTRRKEK